MTQSAKKKVSKNHPWRKTSRQGWLIWTEKHPNQDVVSVIARPENPDSIDEGAALNCVDSLGDQEIA